MLFTVELQESRMQNPSQNSSAARKQDAKEAFLCVSSRSENKYADGESLVSLRCVRLSAHPLAAAANKRWDLWVSVQSFARSCRWVRTDGHMSARWRLPLRIYTKLPGSGLISGQGCCWHFTRSVLPALLRGPQASSTIWCTPAQTHPLWLICTQAHAVKTHLRDRVFLRQVEWVSTTSVTSRLLSTRAIFELWFLGHLSVSRKVETSVSCSLSRALSWRVRMKTKEGRILMHTLALWQPCTLWLLLISTLSAGNRPPAHDFMKQSTSVQGWKSVTSEATLWSSYLFVHVCTALLCSAAHVRSKTTTEADLQIQNDT